MAFVHLHVHTEYSALDGMVRVNEAFDVAKDLGQTALAVTDHGTLGGMWAAKLAAEKAGVKLIAGQEFYLANGSRSSKTPFWVPTEDNAADEDSERSEDGKLITNEDLGTRARPYQHITVLARNTAGWRNLVILNNLAAESPWHKPRIDYDLLREHAEGLIILTGCLGGPVIGPTSHARIWETQADELEAQVAGDLVDEDRQSIARKVLGLRGLAAEARAAVRKNIVTLIEAVGQENVYVEIMDHGIAEESAVIPEVVELAREYGLAVVATNDAHHTHEHQQHDHAAWLAVQSKSTVDNPKYAFHGEGYWLRSEDEMRAVRPEPWWQEACDTTQAIADRCEDSVIPGHRNLLPVFPTPEGFADNREYLYALLREGALRIYGGISATVRDRIRTEMEVIEQSGYIDYFLVVHDLVKWCHDNRILTGPGRGSAAGALVTYLLNITRVDPLRYGLLFERFLEPGRQEPPDIDIDFPQHRRGEVIEYLRQRWGADRVALIGTFQMARSKAAIKDAARVLGLVSLGNKMADLLPTHEAKPLPLRDAFNLQHKAAGGAAAYRALVEKNEDARKVHELASGFEDVIKGYGTHASGVIVSSVPLSDLVPMRKTNAGWVLQWTGPEAEQVGLLKVDVLGLRNLDIIAKTVEYIAESTGEVVDPLDMPDPDVPPAAERERVDKAWRLIAEGRTAGLFQLESPKMTELAMEVAPRSLNDLSALVALYRPGPMGEGLHTEFASRKRDATKVSYRDYTTDPAEQEAIASVLGDTFGIMVYQEQTMLLGTVVAGFDAGMRSKLRKAVSKKKKDLMELVGGRFREGAPLEHRDEAGTVISIPFKETTANTLWSSMVSFAEYAFNRSHSATYGSLAFQTAYLKANWPSAYAAASLAMTKKPEKRIEVLRGLRREGIEVLAPDVNAGNALTAPAGTGQIRIGLAEVSGVGEAGHYIAAARNESSKPFQSMAELARRVTKPDGGGRALDTGHLRALVEAGALDAFGPRLGLTMIVHATHDEKIKPLPMEWGFLEKAARQRRALLLPIGMSPLAHLQAQIKDYSVPPLQQWAQPQRPIPLTRLPDVDGARVLTLGVLAAWKERSYSRGRMANMLIEGSHASIPATLFDDALNALAGAGSLPHVGQIVSVSGKMRFRTIEADPEDDGAEDQVVKEITATSVTVVPVKDPVTGEWPRADQFGIHRVDFLGDPDPDEDGVLELFDAPPVAAEKSAQEPVLEGEGEMRLDVPMALAHAPAAPDALPDGVTPIQAAPSFAAKHTELVALDPVPRSAEAPAPSPVRPADSAQDWSIAPVDGIEFQLPYFTSHDGATLISMVRKKLRLTASEIHGRFAQMLRHDVEAGPQVYMLLRDGVPACYVRRKTRQEIREESQSVVPA